MHLSAALPTPDFSGKKDFAIHALNQFLLAAEVVIEQGLCYADVLREFTRPHAEAVRRKVLDPAPHDLRMLDAGHISTVGSYS